MICGPRACVHRDERSSPQRAAFLRGLREFGYIEGETIQINVSRSTLNCCQEAAEELTQQAVDLILAAGTVPALAAMPEHEANCGEAAVSKGARGVKSPVASAIERSYRPGLGRERASSLLGRQ